jgi:hypothetical protein
LLAVQYYQEELIGEVFVVKYNFNWSAVSGGAPYVTISTISINFNSVSIEKLGNPEKVVIGFDEENRVIGVKAYEENSGVKPYAFADRVKNGWVRVGCRDFVKYLQALTGIGFSPAKKFVATYDNKERILIVEITGLSESEFDDAEET